MSQADVGPVKMKRRWQVVIVSVVTLMTLGIGVYLRLRATWLNEQRIVQNILAIGSAQRGYCGPAWVPRPLKSRLATFDRVLSAVLEDQALPPEMLRDLGALNSLRELKLTYSKPASDTVEDDPGQEESEARRIQAWNAGLEPLRHLHHLERLELGGTPLGDDALQHVAALWNLHDLGLSGTGIHGAGLKNLKALPKLRKLNFRATAVDDDGIEQLQGLLGLRTLILADTQITSVSLYYLQEMKELDYLDLAGTRVSDAGLRHLSKLPKLRILNLDSTKINGAGLKHLQPLENLTVLRLADTPLTPAGLESLQDLEHLAVLDLQGVAVSTTMRATIESALPECKVYFSPSVDAIP